MVGRFEWIILEVGFLGLLVYELVSIRRQIARDKRAKNEGVGASPTARDTEG